MYAELERKLPKRVFVGHYEFALKVVDPATPELEGSDGMTYTDRSEIYIASGMSLRRLLNVVQHEVNHVINWSREIADGASEEEFTTKNSDGTTEMWIDNPGLITWQTKVSREIRKQRSERVSVRNQQSVPNVSPTVPAGR